MDLKGRLSGVLSQLWGRESCASELLGKYSVEKPMREKGKQSIEEKEVK